MTQEEKLRLAEDLNRKYHMGLITRSEKNTYSEWENLQIKKKGENHELFKG